MEYWMGMLVCTVMESELEFKGQGGQKKKLGLRRAN